MINEAQDTALSNRMKQRQDAKIPFLINIEDGRLVPNVAGTRARCPGHAAGPGATATSPLLALAAPITA